MTLATARRAPACRRPWKTSSSADAERALHEAPQLRRHRSLELSSRITDRAAALSSTVSNSAHEIFGLFLDFDVGIADDAERALPLDGVAGKQAPMNKPVTCSSVIMRDCAALGRAADE